MTAARPSGLPDALQLLAAIGQAVIIFDPANVVTHWNPAAEAMFGWSEAEAVGRNVAQLLVPLGLEQQTEDILVGLQAGRPWAGSFTILRKDGGSIRTQFTSSPVRDEDGAVTAIVAVGSQLDDVVRPLLEHSTDAVIVVGADGLVQFASPAVTHVFGWDPIDMIGRLALSFVHPDDDPLLKAALAPGHHRVLPGQLELRVQSQRGAWRWAEASVTDLLEDPAVRGTVINLRDVTDRRSNHERLTHLALHDPLTGLPNRTLMVDRIEHSHTRRGQAGALLLVDLDGLKEINHRYGHAAGDELLRAVGSRLTASLAAQDTCGRIGGDEFLILAESIASAAEARESAGRIQALLSQPLRLAGTTVTLSSSIGITLLAGRHRAHELLREAVAATYDAKRSGFGRYAMFDLLGTHGQDGEGLLGRLSRALAQDELTVHYQPIVALDDRRMVGVEALARWQHPRQGLLAANLFLDVAESSDLIHDIGAFVLREACQQVVRWPDQTGTLAVNISARQLADSALLGVITGALGASGLAPHRLVLEITETALLQDLATALEVLAGCRERGIRISIDDFGTGFAGFGYLRDLPVDEIKIDRSFVAGLGGQGFDAAIVGGIIHMARGLELRTTGEGVETEVQAQVLADLGCDQAQGFLWSPAVPDGPGPPSLGTTSPGTTSPGTTTLGTTTLGSRAGPLPG